MASTYPSIIATLTNPNPTDKLNSPSHSGIETAQNTEIVQIETVIGTGNSVLGTIIGDLRNPNSSGGGHIQSANKGGTGQISYSKGDILVAQSTSVLAKLSVGADGLAIVSDSTQSAGLSYQAVATAPVIQNQTNTYARASVVSGSVYGVILNTPISVLSDGLGLVIKFPTTNTTSVLALSFPFGQSSITARLKNTDLTNPIVGAIQASMIGIVEFDSVSSVFQLQNTYVPTYGTDTTKFLRMDGIFSTVLTGSKIGNTTYNLATASGSQTIPHGLGKIPKFIKITSGTVSGNAGGTNPWDTWCFGSYDGITNQCMSQVNITPISHLNYNSIDGSNIINLQTGSGLGQTATATVDATNIILTWTRIGSTPNGTAYIMWEAIG